MHVPLKIFVVLAAVAAVFTQQELDYSSSVLAALLRLDDSIYRGLYSNPRTTFGRSSRRPAGRSFAATRIQSVQPQSPQRPPRVKATRRPAVRPVVVRKLTRVATTTTTTTPRPTVTRRQVSRTASAPPPVPAKHTLVVLDGELFLVGPDSFVVGPWPPKVEDNTLEDLSPQASRRSDRQVSGDPRDSESFFVSDRPQSMFYMYWTNSLDAQRRRGYLSISQDIPKVEETSSFNIIPEDSTEPLTAFGLPLNTFQGSAEGGVLNQEQSIVTYAFDKPQNNQLVQRDRLISGDEPIFMPHDNVDVDKINRVMTLPAPPGFDNAPEPTAEPEPSPEPEPEPEPSAKLDSSSEYKYSKEPEPSSEPEPSAEPEPSVEPEPSAEPEPPAEPEPSPEKEKSSKAYPSNTDGSRSLQGIRRRQPNAAHSTISAGNNKEGYLPVSTSARTIGEHARNSYLPTYSTDNGSLQRDGRRLTENRESFSLDLPAITPPSAQKSLSPPEASRKFFESLQKQVLVELGQETEGRVAPAQITALAPQEVTSDLHEAGDSGEVANFENKPFTILL